MKMPKHVLVLGSGPIVIGQACEFDYSGSQAVKALKEEGIEVSVLNSNPATIMTDLEMAHHTYIEPITLEVLEKILLENDIDAVLPTVGGQTALNLAMEAHAAGLFEKTNVYLLGAKPDAIELGEDRAAFKTAMEEVGLPVARGGFAHNLEEGFKLLEDTGFPAIMRPSFTLGGTGGGIAYNKEEFEEILKRGLQASPTSQVLVEESLLGWKEIELEVIRDKADNCIVITSIENIDPMGVHTGDSITVAPAQTLSDKEYQNLRDLSFAVMRKVGVETGGSNVQFAMEPETGRAIIIENESSGKPLFSIGIKGYRISDCQGGNQTGLGIYPGSDFQ